MSQIPTTLANRVMSSLPRHLLCCFVLLAISPVVCGEDEQELSNRQTGVAQRYQQLEELLLRLAEMEVAENPERAGLLQRAARQSRDKFVLEKLKSASDSLKTQQFQQAVENQESANQELKSLLTLLMSEDRSKRIRDEKERLTKLDKELKRVLNNQRSARARTENGADLEDVSEEQQAVTERSEELSKQLTEENKQNSPEDTESESGQSGQAQNGKPEQDTGGKPKDDQKKAGEKSEQDDSSQEDKQDPKVDPKDNPEADPQDKDKPDDQATKPAAGESEQNSDQNPQDSPKQQSPSAEQQGDPQQQQQDSPQGQQQQQSQQQQQDSQPSEQNNQPQTPEQAVEKQLQKAIERMQEAEKELEESKREQATEQQRQAEENLRAAIDQLERILRQLREEEMERELAKLESRLRKMVAMQTKVLDDTVALAATPVSQRSRQTDVKAGDLAFEEKKITMEADRAMLLLREEGSSVAFPEVLSQIRSDTTRVADLLGQTKIDAITQGIQQDILAALDEMISAVQKAQRDLEKKRQQEQQGQSQPAQQGEEPLVEALAELKLIRTMETRIKSTTDRYSSLLESGETPSAEVLPLVQDLSDRQNRLYQITRDLVLKRNK